MISKINTLMIGMWLNAQAAMGKLKEEKGDTNLISIIVVLGIVLALVVVFRGYITKILGQIKGAVDSFKNTPF